MRFAKILRFGRTRTLVAIDLYNLFNANPGLTYQQGFAGTGSDVVQPADAADAAVHALQRDGRLLARRPVAGSR